MRGRDDEGSQLQESADDRPRQRRAFLGIGTGAEFVEQHEIVRRHLPQHRDHRSNVPGEGRKTLRDALLVADVDEDSGKDGDHTCIVRRNEQSRLRHERQEADRLQRDRLSARIRTGDEQDAEVLAEIDVDRYDRRRIEQWVARSA